jgi:ABC-2 type transport system ATP-binding protein
VSGHDPDTDDDRRDVEQDEKADAPADRDTVDGPDDVGPDTAIAYQDVTQLYGPRQGLEGLSLRVPTGTIFGLVGPSGSGKTTMVRLALGTLEPQEGHVVTLGKEAATLGRSDRHRVGYLPQDPVLYPELSLRHNLNMMASIHGLAWRGRYWPKGRRGKRARQRVEDMLELVELRDRERTRMGKASGGEQRRLALASALIHGPELVVLDEPTAGIDPVLRERLWERFAELRDDGATLLVTTQYVSEAAHCDLVALLVDGGAAYVGTPDELRSAAGERLGR